jgi:hypothetical protein
LQPPHEPKDQKSKIITMGFRELHSSHDFVDSIDADPVPLPFLDGRFSAATANVEASRLG